MVKYRMMGGRPTLNALNVVTPIGDYEFDPDRDQWILEDDVVSFKWGVIHDTVFCIMT